MVQAVLLGIAQDGGRPQIGCNDTCCATLKDDDTRHPVSLAIIDENQNHHLIDVSRALGTQLRRYLKKNTLGTRGHVLLTHSHFGHVDGLGLFGKEVMGLSNVVLHVSSSMLDLMKNTPMWNILLKDGVFLPNVFSRNVSFHLSPSCEITPVEVPHRSEMRTDTHAFLIKGPNRRLLYLPDHDTWEETLKLHDQTSVRSWLLSLQINIALIDGTFFSKKELKNRCQSDVPHPTVKETLERMGKRQEGDCFDILFIHLNHTNPLYDSMSEEKMMVLKMGWGVAEEGQIFDL